MLLGIPTEIKNHEKRVAITPAGVQELTTRSHRVLVQSGAGIGSGFSDAEYASAGAQIVATAAEAWSAELVLKVKEPIHSEFGYLRPDLTLFTYLHLAADPELTAALLAAGTTAIAYETVQGANRSLPLLAPMSEIAGKLAVQIGANLLTEPQGGPGLLIGGVPGAAKGKVVVIGGGVAGYNAALVAVGMGAKVTVIDNQVPRLRELDSLFGGKIDTAHSTKLEIANQLKDADLVIGSVLIPGAQAPKLVTDDMVAAMKPGSVLVDIAVDQGGCFANTRATTHTEPTYRVHNSTYYCVANIPGAVPLTATVALTNCTLPYVLQLAELGVAAALERNSELSGALATKAGEIIDQRIKA